MIVELVALGIGAVFASSAAITSFVLRHVRLVDEAERAESRRIEKEEREKAGEEPFLSKLPVFEPKRGSDQKIACQCCSITSKKWYAFDYYIEHRHEGVWAFEADARGPTKGKFVFVGGKHMKRRGCTSCLQEWLEPVVSIEKEKSA